jgi:CRP-like cAMP-binding protein
MSRLNLRSLPRFAQAPTAMLGTLEAAMDVQALRPGQALVRHGQPVDQEHGLFVVLSGQLQVCLPRGPGQPARCLRELRAGELVGVAGLVSPHGRHEADVLALTAAEVAHLPRGAFLALYQGRDDISYAFLRVVGAQLASDLARVDGALRGAVASGEAAPLHELL